MLLREEAYLSLLKTDGDKGSSSHFLDYKRPTRPARVKQLPIQIVIVFSLTLKIHWIGNVTGRN